MRCYKVTGPGRVRYAATNADARATRDEMVKNLGVKKPAVTFDQVEVPVQKDQLLVFINSLCTKADGPPDGA